MPEQFHENLQFAGQTSLNSHYNGYRGVSQHSASFEDEGEKLTTYKRFPLWQRLVFTLASLALWAGIMLCFLLAWDYSWSHDLGYTRVILVAVAIITTLCFLAINIFVHQRWLKKFFLMV